MTAYGDERRFRPVSEHALSTPDSRRGWARPGQTGYAPRLCKKINFWRPIRNTASLNHPSPPSRIAPVIFRVQFWRGRSRRRSFHTVWTLSRHSQVTIFPLVKVCARPLSRQLNTIPKVTRTAKVPKSQTIAGTFLSTFIVVSFCLFSTLGGDVCLRRD